MMGVAFPERITFIIFKNFQNIKAIHNLNNTNRYILNYKINIKIGFKLRDEALNKYFP